MYTIQEHGMPYHVVRFSWGDLSNILKSFTFLKFISVYFISFVAAVNGIMS